MLADHVAMFKSRKPDFRVLYTQLIRVSLVQAVAEPETQSKSES